MATKTIRVDYLTRIEGEGGLDLRISDGRVTSAQLNIFEPPRFFEAFLRGRGYAETPDLVARICGICPIAYQMSAVHAIEHAFGVTVDGQLRALRRLIYCGEWIESHALHVVMLHAPDFLGFPDAIRMAREHADMVRSGLALKKAGNELMGGGRFTPSMSRRVASIGFRAARNWRPLLKASRARTSLRSAWCAGSRLFRSRTSSGIMSSSRCGIRTNIRSTRDGWSRIAISISTSPTMRHSSRSGMSRIQRRCIRC